MSYERAFERARARRLARAGRRRLAGAAAVGAGTLVLTASGAEAATLTVSNLNDAGAGSLRQAVLDANAALGADTVVFAPGLTGQIDVGSEIPITETLTIRGPATSPGIVLSGGDTTRILNAVAGDLTLADLTLRDGNAGGGSGGALSASGDSLTLERVAVRSSSAFRGGGVFAGLNDVAISDSVFEGNTASYSGGGFASDGTFAVAADDRIVISDTVVTGNTSTTNGGGLTLYDNYVPATIERSTITGNTVTGAGGSAEDGGGIWLEDTYDGMPTLIRDSTITGNTTPDGGGGVAFGENFSGASEVVNSTIAGNTAATGGGVLFADAVGADGRFALRNSTVTGNTATDRGGGVFRGYSGGGVSNAPLTVSSSVVAGNVAANGGAEFAAQPGVTGDLTIGHSLVQDAAGLAFTALPPGSVLSGVDPQLGTLTDNGGPVQTRLPSATSPLLDAGAAGGLTTDARGRPRTVDLPDVANLLAGDGTDIGAVEYEAPPAPAPPPAPAAAPAGAPAAPAPPPRCGGVSMTFQPVLVGRRVRFTGVALARYAGRTVSIVSDGKTVATGPIRADGTFSLSAPAPPRSRRASTKYEAVSGHLRTRRFRLMRRAYVVKAERGSISGRVRSTRTRRRGARATLFVQVSCTKRRKVATARVTAAGRFRLRLPRSTPGEFAVYQVRVKLRGMTTWTYPVLVRP